MIEFISKYKLGHVEEYLKSATAVGLQRGKVAEIVGKNFHHTVTNNTPPSLVLFYTPWCSHCYDYFDEFDRLLVDIATNVMVGRVDISTNDIPNIDSVPTVVYYGAGAQVKFDGKPSQLHAWILELPIVRIHRHDEL